MEISRAKELVKEKLPDKRYQHSLRVADTAVKLAEIYDGDIKKAELAGILHDYCKYEDLSTMYQIVRQYELESDLLSYGGEILHGPVCAALMKKLVFIADYIEPGRKTPGVEEIRDMAYNQGSLDKTIYEISKRTVLFLIEKDITVYGATIACLNYYNYSDERIKDD